MKPMTGPLSSACEPNVWANGRWTQTSEQLLARGFPLGRSPTLLVSICSSNCDRVMLSPTRAH